MKSSFSTNGQLFMMIFIVLLVFVTSSASRFSHLPPSSAMLTSTATSHHHRHHPPRHESQHHPCDALTRDISRSLCIHLHGVYQHPLPVLVPMPSLPLLIHHEIDPRYGVEKRLVPSGPNPLHN